MRRRLRASVDNPKPPNGPVVHIAVDPWLWQVALDLAEHDVTRIVIYDAETVAVFNSRTAANTARRDDTAVERSRSFEDLLRQVDILR